MSLFSSILPIVGGVGGFMLGGPAGAAAGASLGSSIAGVSSANKAAKNQAQAQRDALAASRTQLNPFALVGPGGMQIYGQPGGQGSVNAGDLEGARAALSQFGANGVPNAWSTGLPAGVQQALAGMRGVGGVNFGGIGPYQLSPIDLNLGGLDQLSGPVNSQIMAALGQLQGLQSTGFQRGLQNTAFSGAGAQIADASRTYGDVFNSTLGNLRQLAQPEETRAFDTLQNRQFMTGQAGTSGGALQTEAFARGLGQADLSRQLAASGEARVAQQQSLGMAQGLTGIGSGLASQEQAMLQQALGQFSGLTGLGADLNTQRFQRSMYGSQFGLDAAQFDLQRQMANLQGQLQAGGFNSDLARNLFSAESTAANLPYALQGSQLQNVLAALQGVGGINSQAMNLYQLGQGTEQAAANARIGAGSNMASIVGSPGFATAGYGPSNMFGALASSLAPQGGAIPALMDMWQNKFGTPSSGVSPGWYQGNTPADLAVM